MCIDDAFQIDFTIVDSLFQDWQNPNTQMSISDFLKDKSRRLLWRICRVDNRCIFRFFVNYKVGIIVPRTLP